MPALFASTYQFNRLFSAGLACWSHSQTARLPASRLLNLPSLALVSHFRCATDSGAIQAILTDRSGGFAH